VNANRLVLLFLPLLAAASSSVQPREESVSPLIQQALAGTDGKQFTAAVVTFPPGARAAPHRHGQAFLYAYVLEGAVRSRLEGEPARLYRSGEGWAEQPGAHHLVAENASNRVPARLLVIFVSNRGEPLKTPDPR
jgi:quercetin dioxygenase-like cupin family protein